MYMSTSSELNPSNSNPSYFVVLRRPPPKRPSIRLHRLNRRRRRLSKESREKKASRVGVLKREMEIKNIKLYMENQSIIKENDKLRQKALLLHQENKALLSQLQKVSYPPWLANLALTKSQQHL